MQNNKIFLTLMMLVILISSVSAVPPSGTFNINNPIPDGYRPSVYDLNISSTVGTNNQTYVFFNGNTLANYSDVIAVLNNDSTQVQAYTIGMSQINGNLQMQINVTANGSLQLYYGGLLQVGCNLCNNSNSTYPVWDNFTASNLKSNWTASGTGSAIINANSLLLHSDEIVLYPFSTSTDSIVRQFVREYIWAIG